MMFLKALLYNGSKMCKLREDSLKFLFLDFSKNDVLLGCNVNIVV